MKLSRRLLLSTSLPSMSEAKEAAASLTHIKLLNGRMMPSVGYGTYMRKDEYDISSSSPLTEMLPLLVGVVAIVIGLGAASRTGALNAPIMKLVDIVEKNMFLQAFVASSCIGGFSYVVVYIGRTIMSKIRGRMWCSVTMYSGEARTARVLASSHPLQFFF